MFCIILADRPHGSCKHSACKCTFFKPGLRVGKFEKNAFAFSCGQWIHILCISPHPSTSSLRPLNPATSHNNNNNNNNNYMLVFMLQKILSPLGLIGQNIKLLCHYAERKRIMFLFCLASAFIVCSYTVRKLYAYAPSLLRFWWISSATYRPGIWTKACWVICNGSVWTQIFLKRCQGRLANKLQ